MLPLKHILRNFVLTVLIASPIALYLGMTSLRENMVALEKAPFTHFSGLDPRTQIYITWETAVPGAGAVWVGTSPDALALVGENTTQATLHRFAVAGLAPGTRHYYQVGTPGSAPGDRSLVQSFVTAPATTSAFNFTLISDTQQFLGTGHHGRVAPALASLDTGFIANVGDIGQEPDWQGTWNLYFAEANQYLAKNSFVPVLGNHDGHYPDSLYTRYFGASHAPDRFFYAFNWSNVCFVVGEIGHGDSANPDQDRERAQDAWINATLAQAQDKDFRVLMFHRNMYSATGTNQELADRIYNIARAYNISLIIHGHMHHYERILFEDYTTLCLGGGGGMQDVFLSETEYTQVRSVGPSLTQITVDGDLMGITTYSPDLAVIDQINLRAVAGLGIQEVL
jgi:hypothetical protein